MAFTLLDVKMFVTVNVLHERALLNEFCSQMFLIYFVCCIFIAIPHGFAFNHTSLHITYALWASKIDASANFKFLALATANANVYNCV